MQTSRAHAVRRRATARGRTAPPVADQRLTRARVLQAALRLLAAHGVAGLSMRALATALETAPMSLYRHVRSKDELVRALVAQELERLDVAVPPRGAWTARAAAWMHALRDQLRRAPAVVAILIHEGHYAPALLRATNTLLRLLREAGFEGEAAVRASREIMWSTLGFVSAEIRGPAFSPSFYVEALREANGDPAAKLRAEDVTEVAAHMPYLITRDLDEVFAAIVEHLLQGLAAEVPLRRRRVKVGQRARNR